MALTGVLALVAAALLGGARTAHAAGDAPCDLYAAGGTPCVAAHSTTRALYSSYDGALYQVKRSSDGATRNIGLLSTGGYADAASQDSFCSGTSCVITVIYDQSGRGNDLTRAPGGGAAGGPDDLADASLAPVTVAGHQAYGVFIAPGTGYRDDDTSGIATGDQPEGMYAVLDGTHYNGGCCFDYGNAETSNNDTGNGHMEAIYFGNSTWWGSGSGHGPWVMADQENGLFSGVDTGYNANDPTVNDRFLTAMVKGEPHHWAIRAGDAQSGGLSTFYDGARPNASGYDPMHKEGAIILGIGGDNSKGSAGTFYEGVLTSGYPSAATEDAVQADIASVHYATRTPSLLDPGRTVSLRATTTCCTKDYVKHDDSDPNVVIAPVSSASPATDRGDASWVVRAGLANAACVSFESANEPGKFLRHYDFRLRLDANDGSWQFAQDATFCKQATHDGKGVSFESVNYGLRYLRHFDYTVYVASDGGSNSWDSTAYWNQDTSWDVTGPLD